MKQIIAVVQPFLAETVINALRLAPLEAIHVREVKGYGRQKNYLNEYSHSEYDLAFLPKVEIVLWVADSRIQETIQVIKQAAHTGRMGDGKIFVVPLADSLTEIDIASGERR